MRKYSKILGLAIGMCTIVTGIFATDVNQNAVGMMCEDKFSAGYKKIYNECLAKRGDCIYATFYAIYKEDFPNKSEKELNYLTEQFAKVYKETVGTGKSHFYSLRYAQLLTMHLFPIEKLEEISKAYERERIYNNSHYYADYYSWATLVKNMSESSAKVCARIYEEKRNKLFSYYYSNYYVELIVDRKVMPSVAHKWSKIYEGERNEGKSYSYADCYSTLIIERGLNEKEARRYAEMNESLAEKKVRDCYDFLLVADEVNDVPKRQIKIYEFFRRKRKSIYYAYAFSRTIMNENFDVNDAEKFASMYEIKRNEGESHLRAYYCTNLIVNHNVTSRLASMQTNIYESQIKKGKSHYYADHYAYLIVTRSIEKVLDKFNYNYTMNGLFDYIDIEISNQLEMDDEIGQESSIKKQAELYEKRRGLGYDHGNALYYIKIYDKFDYSDVACKMNIYDQKRQEGQSHYYAEAYADAYDAEVNNFDEAHGKALEYEKKSYKDIGQFIYYGHKKEKINEFCQQVLPEIAKERWNKLKNTGVSDYFAEYYINNENVPGMTNELNTNRSLAYERERNKGKSRAYALYIVDLLDESQLPYAKCVKMAEEYEKCLKKGRSDFIARYYARIKIENELLPKWVLDEWMYVFEREYEISKSIEFADYYAMTRIKNEYISEPTLRKQAAVYDLQRQRGKSKYYSYCYAKLDSYNTIDKEDIDEYAEKYEELIAMGYDMYYAELVVLRNMSRETALQLDKNYKALAGDCYDPCKVDYSIDYIAIESNVSDEIREEMKCKYIEMIKQSNDFKSSYVYAYCYSRGLEEDDIHSVLKQFNIDIKCLEDLKRTHEILDSMIEKIKSDKLKEPANKKIKLD